jgi:hypothetical protein
MRRFMLNRFFVLVAVFFTFSDVGPASAACVCRCVSGEMQPICSSSIDLPPICPPTVCAIVPPPVAPMQAPTVPPIGTTQCSPRQVLNPYTQQYEWRSICE